MQPQERCCSLCHPGVETVVVKKITQDRIVIRESLQNKELFQTQIRTAIDAWINNCDTPFMHESPDYKDLPSKITAEIQYIDNEKYLLHHLEVWDESLSSDIISIIEEHAPLIS